MQAQPNLVEVHFCVEPEAETVEAPFDFVSNGLLVRSGHPRKLSDVPGSGRSDGGDDTGFQVWGLISYGLDRFGMRQENCLDKIERS